MHLEYRSFSDLNQKIIIAKSILLILLIYLPVSCINKKEALPVNVIPLASAVGNYSILDLSEYVTEIRYIPLETNDSVLVGDIQLINYEDNKILIKDDQQSCFLFDEKGTFCRKIGQTGQGPGDYIYVKHVFIHDHFLFLEDHYKILIFDTNGILIKTINLRPIYDEYNGLGIIFLLKKDTFVMDVYSSYKHYPKAVLFETYQSDAIKIKEYPNHIILNKIRPGSFVFERGSMWRFNDEVRIYKVINDTIFSIDQNMDLKTAFIFESGKFKPTISFLERKEEIHPDLLEFINPGPFYESTGHLFIEFWFMNAPQPHEFTTQYGTKGIDRRVFGVFDKLTGEFTLMLQPVKGKFGFKNDIDNGPVIWPNYISSNNEFVTFVSAEEFLDYYEKIEKPSPQMAEIAKNLSWDDNPIVIIAKLN